MDLRKKRVGGELGGVRRKGNCGQETVREESIFNKNKHT